MMQWKQFKFITVVQTCILANAINKSRRSDADSRVHEFSATGAFIAMDDAFWAAENIPFDLDAMDAANQFITYMLKEEGAKLPHWAERH